MYDQMEKVKWLRSQYPLLDIEVDGGVGPSTISCCAEVNNSSVFVTNYLFIFFNYYFFFSGWC